MAEDAGELLAMLGALPRGALSAELLGTAVAQARANLPLAVLSAVAHALGEPERVGRTVLHALVLSDAATGAGSMTRPAGS